MSETARGKLLEVVFGLLTGMLSFSSPSSESSTFCGSSVTLP